MRRTLIKVLVLTLLAGLGFLLPYLWTLFFGESAPPPFPKSDDLGRD